MIYFIKAVHSGAIKIGISNDPKRRLEAMQTGSPEPLELIGVLPGQLSEERWLHERFKAYRIHGEWFKGDEEFMRRIDLLVRASIEEVIDSNPAAYWLIEGEAGNDSGGWDAEVFCVCRDGCLIPDPNKMIAAISPHGHRFSKIESITNVSESRYRWPEDLEVLREPLTSKSCLVWAADLSQIDHLCPVLPESRPEPVHPAASLVVGSFVKHPQYGVGQVIHVLGKGPGQQGHIHFGTEGVKIFASPWPLSWTRPFNS